MKFTALLVAALAGRGLAKELPPDESVAQLYESGTRHMEIMALKHVRLFPPAYRSCV
jgi:hypothetical protein